MNTHDIELTRRGLVGGAAWFGLLAGARPMWAGASAPSARPAGKAKAAILLWLNGGPSQFETWSPAEGKETGGPTKALATNVPGIVVSENLPKMAKRADKITILRAMTSHLPAHEPARELMHTGHSPNATLSYPSVGAVVCKELAAHRVDLPGFITINGDAPDEGFLEAEFAPFAVQRATQQIQNLDPGRDVGDGRLKSRRDLLKTIEKSFAADRQAQDLIKRRQDVYESAKKLMDTPLLNAFDLSREKETKRKQFGAHDFGQGCLMARRLVQAGVRFVEVVLNGWDTHQDNFVRSKRLASDLDDGFSALLDDLAEQKLLDETLVICMGEFGRTPRINEQDGRDHYARAFSGAIAGAGVSTGVVLGAVDPEGREVKDRPVEPAELTATIYERFGIDYTKTYLSPRGRPMKLSEKTPIKELV
jgi:hypothetical protein